jgi:hypothetical protein
VHRGDFVDILVVGAIGGSALENMAAEHSSIGGKGHSLVVNIPEGLEERCSLDLDKLMVVEPFVQTLAEVSDTG